MTRCHHLAYTAPITPRRSRQIHLLLSSLVAKGDADGPRTDGTGLSRPGSMAVRHHDRLPLHPRPAHDRPVPARGAHGDQLRAHRQRAMARRHQVLRQDPADQLRTRRGHRHRAGVPVRHELVGVLPLRRQHLRRSTGLRGASRLLHGIDLPRPVDLRLGPPVPQAAQPVHVDGRPGNEHLRLLHPRRQLLDAASGRHSRQSRHRPRRARRHQRLLRSPEQPHPVDHPDPYRVLRLPGRRRRRPRRFRMVDDQGRSRRAEL